jgi:hypothetical protein
MNTSARTYGSLRTFPDGLLEFCSYNTSIQNILIPLEKLDTNSMMRVIAVESFLGNTAKFATKSDTLLLRTPLQTRQAT